MGLFKGLRARGRALLRPAAADRDLRDEIAFHLDRETEQNIRLGMSPAHARRLAVARFGGVERVREDHRDVRRLRWIGDAAADIRFALRALRRTPALAAAAVLTLALGMGANIAIFSAVNAVVLRSLPFPAPDRLMMITEENPEKHWHLNYAAPANMLDWRAGVQDFQDVMGYFDGLPRATLTGHGEPRVLTTSIVTGNFFSTLGARAALGRTFTFDETYAGGPRTVVLSDRAWRDSFGGHASIVGTSIVLDGAPALVVGVMPPGFEYPKPGIDVWLTMRWSAAQRAGVSFRRAHSLRVVARLTAGASRARADAELQAVVARLKRDYPSTNKYMGALMMPLHDYLVRDTRLPLLLLLTSAGLLLLIACANVGNLMLVQAAGRGRELALRTALGAGRGRLARQLLTESLVLSTAGGALGLALGWIGTRVFLRLQPKNTLPVGGIGLDGTVIAYAAGVTLLSGIVFGLAPALWARRRNVSASLKSGGRTAVDRGGARRWSEVLVIAEVALALVMTVGAGLLVRSFLDLRRVDPGFDPHGVLTAGISLNRAYDTDERVSSFMTRLEAAARAFPGVTGAAMAMNVPFTGTSYTSDFTAWGRGPNGYGTEVAHAIVSPAYFATMRIPLVRGRAFGPQDAAGATPVVLINEALARAYFEGQDPIGQRMAFDKVPTASSTWYTIIGITGNEHLDGYGLPAPIAVYHSSVQEPSSYMNLLIRTDGSPTALVSPLRALLHQLDPSLALMEVTTMDTLADASLARTRFLTMLLLVFAAIGVALAVVGVYGVLAHVTRSTMHEMGIRLALGASPSAVRHLVALHGVRLAAAGLMIGGAAALFATRAMTAVLFGVAPNDPWTLAASAALLALTSAAAAWIPATRASRADPLVALRE